MSQTLADQLFDCLNTPIQAREGRLIPHPDRVTLRDGGVFFDGAVLYSDLVASSLLSVTFGDGGAAKIIQAFVLGCSHIVGRYEGEITAYDGDRVMAVFGGTDKEDDAVSAALEISFMVNEVLNDLVEHVLGRSANVHHCSGVDCGDMLAVKVGRRGNADLLWSGRPANLAAKLCMNRSPVYSTIVTARVHQRLSDRLKYDGRGSSHWKRFGCKSVDMQVLGTNVAKQV